MLCFHSKCAQHNNEFVGRLTIKAIGLTTEFYINCLKDNNIELTSKHGSSCGFKVVLTGQQFRLLFNLEDDWQALLKPTIPKIFEAKHYGGTVHKVDKAEMELYCNKMVVKLYVKLYKNGESYRW